MAYAGHTTISRIDMTLDDGHRHNYVVTTGVSVHDSTMYTVLQPVMVGSPSQFELTLLLSTRESCSAG